MNELTHFVAWDKWGNYRQISTTSFLNARKLAKREFGANLEGIRSQDVFCYKAIKAELAGKPIVHIDDTLRRMYLNFIWNELESVEFFAECLKISTQRAWAFINAKERALGLI